VTAKNIEASVHARLQNHARGTKRPFQELLQYFAMERFLYRLSKSPHRSRFVLKRALMLHVWDAPLARATKDVEPWDRHRSGADRVHPRLHRAVVDTGAVDRVPQQAPERAIAQCPERLSEVTTFLAAFLLPVARACATGESFELRWTPCGPWGAEL
jgi:hypothetical protein